MARAGRQAARASQALPERPEDGVFRLGAGSGTTENASSDDLRQEVIQSSTHHDRLAGRAWFGATRVGGGIREPRRIRTAAPVYPEIAKEARVQGLVILRRHLLGGEVDKVGVLRGIPPLGQTAIEAVRQLEYTPTLLDGVAVAVIRTGTVNFKLS